MSYEVLPGGARLVERLDGMIARVSDLAPVFEAVIADFRRITAKRFAENGPGWPPLAESTMSMTGSWARTNQNFDEILVDTGVMFDSLMGSGSGGFERVGPDYVEVGTSVPYAHWHQTGGTTPGRPPQRKIVDLTPLIAEEWAAVTAGWIGGGVIVEVA